LRALQPLDQEAAHLTFVDIADSGHNLEEVDRILSLTDNMSLDISLLAHLADTEGCSNIAEIHRLDFSENQYYFIVSQRCRLDMVQFVPTQSKSLIFHGSILFWAFDVITAENSCVQNFSSPLYFQVAKNPVLTDQKIEYTKYS
jgi:hypothetical protein